MKKLALTIASIGFVAAVAMCVIVAVATAAEVTSINVVGYYKIPLATNAWNLISVPMQKIPLYRGVITDNTTNVITDSAATWVVAEWAKATSGKETYGKSTFYIEISDTNSGFEGHYYTIFTNAATTLTVEGSDFAAHNLSNCSYKIVAHNRIRDIFGEATNAVLTGGNSVTNLQKDEIWMWGGTWLTAMWAKTNATAGWRQGGSTVVDDQPIQRDEGLFVRMRAGNKGTNITVTGEVLAEDQFIAIDQGWNLVGGGAAIDTILQNTGLTNLTGANSVTNLTRDEIWEWSNGWLTAVWLKTNANPALNSWKRGGSTAMDTALVFRAGSSYFINRKSAVPAEWNRVSPLK